MKWSLAVFKYSQNFGCTRFALQISKEAHLLMQTTFLKEAHLLMQTTFLLLLACVDPGLLAVL